MKKIKKEYTYSRGRLIWRLLPTNDGKLIIEERDLGTKEVYFSCVAVDSGKKVFYDFQLEEKHWAGIESIYKDFIFFHKFTSRDMPDHKGIIAFDINNQKIVWQTEEYSFDFIFNDKIYCYKNKFEGREYFVLDYKSGSLLENLEGNSFLVNNLREESLDENNSDNYLFSEPIDESDSSFPILNPIAEDIRSNKTIVDQIQYILFRDIAFISFHEGMKDGNIVNHLRAIDIQAKKIIFEKILNSNNKTIVPDSYFIKDNLLFLLIEKSILEVRSISI